MEITKEKLELAASIANHEQLLVMYEAVKSERDALTAQVEQLEICLKERKAVCHQAFDANEAMKTERDALSATTEALRDALQCLFNDIGGGKKFCGHDFTCVCAGDKARAALVTTKQQHLAEIMAQAGREGFVSGYEFCLSTLPSPYSNLIAVNYKGMAERYADSIRQGAK